ncbi:MAG: HAD-IA family hydrolase [Myxococcota bacterium]
MSGDLRAVLFDAAGTLIELREPVGETYSRLAADYGVELSAWRIGEAFGRVFRAAPLMVFPGEAPERIPGLERDWWRALVRAAFRAADGTARFSDFEAYFERLYAHFASPDTWRATPESGEMLAELRRRGLVTAIVSNFDRRLHRILEGLGLSPLFDAVVLPSDAGAAKPDPRIFAFALERVGSCAAATLFVGDDRDRDLAGARCAGLRAIEVQSLATLAELPDRLEALPQE